MCERFTGSHATYDTTRAMVDNMTDADLKLLGEQGNDMTDAKLKLLGRWVII